MRRRTRGTLYLSILAAAVLAWAPLYPVLFALTSSERSVIARFVVTKPRYIYFADSVITTSSPCENDHRNIVQMLPPAISSQTMLFAGDGGNAHLWRDAALFLAAHGHGTVAAAVIPINMGVFSAGWEHNPDYQFEQDGMLFNLASGQTSLSQYWRYLKDVHSPSRPARHLAAARDAFAMPIMVGGRAIGTLGQIGSALNMPEIPCKADLARYAKPLSQRFAINYGVQLTPADPYFADLDETIRRLENGGIRPILYITPLNLQSVGRFGGAALLAQLKANVALVRDWGRQWGWNIIDLSGSLSADHFITRDCACEHVDAFGRALIARHVAAALPR
jgi:hypothetical protein